jgi:hypothetical protein
MAIFKAAAWYSLTDEELEEILSCSNTPVLTAYVDGASRAAVLLWEFIMPREAKDVFQNDVFHPASVDPKHLGMTVTTGQRIFDMQICFTYSAYSTCFLCFDIFCIFSVGRKRSIITFVPLSFQRRRLRMMLLPLGQ